ncbi:MAG: hypothetical protein ACMXYG_02930 [Candidatus Woesearchaeota archaeon]
MTDLVDSRTIDEFLDSLDEAMYADKELYDFTPEQLVTIGNILFDFFDSVMIDGQEPLSAYNTIYNQYQLDERLEIEFANIANRADAGFRAVKLIREITQDDPKKMYSLIYGGTVPEILSVDFTPLHINFILPEKHFEKRRNVLGTAYSIMNYDLEKECLEFISDTKKGKKSKANLAGLVASINEAGIQRQIPENKSSYDLFFLSLYSNIIDESVVRLHEQRHVLEHYIHSYVDYSHELVAEVFSELQPSEASFQRAARINYGEDLEELKTVIERSGLKRVPEIVSAELKRTIAIKQAKFDQLHNLDPHLVEEIIDTGFCRDKLSYMLSYVPTEDLSETLIKVRDYLKQK